MRLLYIICCLFFISCKKNVALKSTFNTNNSFTWIQKPAINYVDNELRFIIKSTLSKNNINLFITNDYGSTIVKPFIEAGNFVFTIPKHFYNRRGILNYAIVSNQTVLETSHIVIQPSAETKTLETYCGPQHVVASKTDFAMLVTIPTDEFDNPNATAFTTTELFREKRMNNQLNSQDILTYQHIYSKAKKGKIFVRAYTDTIQSKLLEITILSNNPTDFKIEYDRNNAYADSKELTTVKTSIIKDQYGNIIENGTLVSFYITNGAINMKAFGKTINGIAIAQIVHPSEERTYSVQAFVEGFATSNTLTINYKSPIQINKN